MSSVKEEGKDRVIFVTKEDHAAPSNAELVEEDPNDPYEEKGLILPNGDINWNCPCLGGMASGPCGTPFKEAFSCFHFSAEEVKGSDCLEQFRAMQECMQSYPDLYPQDDDHEDPAPPAPAQGEPSPAPTPAQGDPSPTLTPAQGEPSPAPEQDSNPADPPPPPPSEGSVGS